MTALAETSEESRVLQKSEIWQLSVYLQWLIMALNGQRPEVYHKIKFEKKLNSRSAEN